MSQITGQTNNEAETAYYVSDSNVIAIDAARVPASSSESDSIPEEARKAAAEVDAAGKHEPQLRENGIPEEVLEKLLPGDDVITLAEPTVAGGIGYRFIKRTFDVCSTGLALIALAIPMAVIAIKIKSESPGPAIYAQERVGKDGKYFKVYKFRSMYIDAEARGARWAAGDDPRVTPFGKFMRKTRIDEIPQFWNIFKGDIPSRILKTRRGFSLKTPGAFALPANVARTRIAAYLQVKALVSAIAGVSQNLFRYFTADHGVTRGIFAKPASRVRIDPSCPLSARYAQRTSCLGGAR